jgi:hypothetical protein
MSVNSVLTGSWKKSNTDLHIHSITSSVSPKLTITPNTLIELSDEYDTWSFQYFGGTEIPVGGKLTFVFSYEGHPPSSFTGIFQVLVGATDNVNCLAVPSVSVGNSTRWNLTIHNLGTESLFNIALTLKRLRV